MQPNIKLERKREEAWLRFVTVLTVKIWIHPIFLGIHMVYAWDVAKMWLIGGWDVAEIMMRCGQVVAKIWLRSGTDVAEM